VGTHEAAEHVADGVGLHGLTIDRQRPQHQPLLEWQAGVAGAGRGVGEILQSLVVGEQLCRQEGRIRAQHVGEFRDRPGRAVERRRELDQDLPRKVAQAQGLIGQDVFAQEQGDGGVFGETMDERHVDTAAPRPPDTLIQRQLALAHDQHAQLATVLDDRVQKLSHPGVRDLAVAAILHLLQIVDDDQAAPALGQRAE